MSRQLEAEMNRIALLIPFFAIACGDPEVGDTCDADEDCEGGEVTMFCDMATDEEEGTCQEDDGGGETDTDM
jgi:hypothetical protein